MIEQPLPFSDLLSRCHSYEILNEPTVTVEPVIAPLPTANNVQHSVHHTNRGGRGRGTLGRGRGIFRPNHFQPMQNYNRPRCIFCGGNNHVSYHCNYKPVAPSSAGILRSSPSGYSPSANLMTPQSPSYQSASHPSLSSLQWYPDTGANYHVTPDLAGINQVTEYYGMYHLQVANGSHLSEYTSHRID